jgi:hypothetical protein
MAVKRNSVINAQLWQKNRGPDAFIEMYPAPFIGPFSY